MADVSVIIPTWNRAATIERAVRSALEQTNSPREVLVCDDGSTDDSNKIIQAIEDNRVHWIEGARGGRPAIPRNRGIRESRGEWLAFLDSDDEWLPEKLEIQLALAEKSGCRAVCSNAQRLIPGKGVEGNLLEWGAERVTFSDLLQVNHIICSSTLIQKSLFPMVAGFPEDEHLQAWEDYALWLRIATQTDFAFVTEPLPLVIYRDDVANSVRNNKVDVWSKRKAVFNDLKCWGERQGISSAYLRKVGLQERHDLLNSRMAKLLGHAIRMKKAFLK
jgi:glycosyltransferase involved in cell wall biosynthesis